MNTKRSEGEFYTPVNFARFSHEIIAKQFGDDWAEKYVVWDPAWGMGNLTVDKKFTNLYASTLNSCDIENSTANPEATKFRFDFLNDPITSIIGIEIPSGLYDALKNNRPIIFLMNPPYAAPTDLDQDRLADKEVSVFNMVQGYMGKLKQARSNLFSQFLYRVMMIKQYFGLTDCNICVFSSTIFLSGTGYDRFRDQFLKEFRFECGYLFNAKYFDECSGRWGISFSVWKSGETENKKEFIHDVIRPVGEDGKIKVTGKKVVYNIDGEQSFREMCKEPVEGKETYPTVTVKSALTVGNSEGGRLTSDAIGFYVNVGNNIYQSLKSCYILSSCPNSVISGFSITPDNFELVCANFTARKCVHNDWINNKDEYRCPDINECNAGDWEEFCADSVVYSIFNPSSNQAALRDVEWMGGKYRIKNEFFFISRHDMMELAGFMDNTECVKSGFDDDDRFVWKYIHDKNLEEIMSDEAREVLEKGIELTKKSFVYRKEFDRDHKEFHINNWDCGYAQLKVLWEIYMEKEFKEFRKSYKKLTNKLKKQVFALDMLK